MTETAGQGDKLNVFISYSRDDLAFAEQLYAALEAFGFGLAMDQRGISAGEDWQKRLNALIRDADTVAFVLSPSSARSEMCAWEVGEAVRLGKRILPVLCRSLEDAKAPEKLASLNYIFFYAEPRSDGSGFGSGLALLVKALNTDLDWLREHTRYLQRATEWDTGGRSASRLLSGPDIASAKAWVARRPKDAPEATPLQLDFIKASETEEIRQQSVEAQRLQEISEAQAAREKALADREKAQQLEAEARKSEAEAQKREAAEARRVAQRTMAGLAAALVLAVVAGWFAWTANQQRDVALEATRTANMQRDRAQLQESRALATLAQQASKEGDQPTAMLLALEALPDPGFGGKRPWSSEGAAALHQAWLRNRETVLAGHRGHVNSTSFGADDAHVVTASDDKTARVWDLRGERPSFVALEGHKDRVLSASLSADGTHVVTASADRTARVWDLRSAPPTFVALEGHHGAVFSASFSTDGTHVVTASSDKTARVWDLRGERPSFVALEGHRDLVYFASFSADGTHVLTASLENTARVWDLRGERPSFVALEGHQRPVYSASFSADGTHVVTASGDKTARVWDLRGERPSFVALEGHSDAVSSASFSADGTHVVTTSSDKTARVWDLGTEPPSFVALEGYQSGVHSASFSADGAHVVTASLDGTTRVWDLRAEPPSFVALEGHQSGINSASFSADGAHVVRAFPDGTARVWDLRREQPNVVALEGHQGVVNSASFSADGTHVVTASSDKTARVWDLRARATELCRPRGAPGYSQLRVVQRRRHACGYGVR